MKTYDRDEDTLAEELPRTEVLEPAVELVDTDELADTDLVMSC